ncbi:MAG: hypothetical protein WED07_13740 [Candidatus Freyarchaeum deiterrae]
MSNNKTVSDNKNEILVEGEPDVPAVVLFAKTAIDETSKIYGPIFARLVSVHALRFEAEKLKEEPPNIQGLTDVSNYIVTNMNKYTRGYCAVIYGVGKAEATLQGSMGAGAKRSAWSAMRSMLENTGLLNNLVGTTGDILEAIDKFNVIGKQLKTVLTVRFIRDENNQVREVVPNCPFKDACKALVKEGVTRVRGGMECMSLIANTAVAGIITKKSLDYNLDEFDKPECRGRIFEP